MHLGGWKRALPILVPIAILLVGFAAFSPALRGAFLSWDDYSYIRDNGLIRDLSPSGLGRMFRPDTFVMGNYHPLTLLSFAVEWRFAGQDPFWYHLDNILLHLANCALVHVFALFLGFSWPVAAITSLLFAVHPMRVESVAWAAARKDVLSTFFVLLALICYARFVRLRSGALLVLSFFAFVFALLAKGQAVTLPVLLLLVDYRLKRPRSRAQILEKVPFFLCSVVFGILALRAQASYLTPERLTVLSAGERILVAAHGVVLYLVKFVVPYPLSAFYPYPASIGAPFYLIPAAAVVALGAALLWFRRLRLEGAPAAALLLFGTSFFLTAILPVSQILPVGDAIMADRYTYLAYLGLMLMLAEGSRVLASRSPAMRVAVTVPLTAFLLALSLLTYQRTQVWRNNLTLWDDVIAKTPSALAYNNRGMEHLDAGRAEAAIADFDLALRADPGYAAARSNRGLAHLRGRNHDLARRDFEAALAQDPSLVSAFLGRGILWMEAGQHVRAIADFDAAIRIDPRSTKAHYNRGVAYRALGDDAEAIAAYSAALAILPDNVSALTNRANARYRLSLRMSAASGSPDAVAHLQHAVEDYTRVLEITPGDANALSGRSASLHRLGQNRAALADAQRARALGFPVDEQYLRLLEREAARQ